MSNDKYTANVKRAARGTRFRSNEPGWEPKACGKKPVKVRVKRGRGTYSRETGHVSGLNSPEARRKSSESIKRLYAGGHIYGMKQTMALINESKRLQTIRRAVEEGKVLEDVDPKAYEAMGVILQIMRGEIGGRHLTARLTAARAVLEQQRGTPMRQIEIEIGSTYAELIENATLEHGKLKAIAAGSPEIAKIIEGEVIEAAVDDHPPSGDHDEVPDLDLSDYV